MSPPDNRPTVKERPVALAAPRVSPTYLGKYEILRHVASGGMADLYLARATGIEGFEKLVVIKRILPFLQGSRGIVDMFLAEARLAAALRHSNIVQVFDIGTQDGEYFFAMEFLHGEDVGSIIRRTTAAGGAVPLEHVVNIGLGVCAGLHYAHERVDARGEPLGIVHRDISPQNVFVTFEGEVKLLDFGIAKARDRLVETQQGTLKGKIRYMSPEQARAEPLDRRTDIFSLGITLWELITGCRLFRAQGDLEVLQAITESDAPAPSRVNEACPEDLDRIVLRALRRDPAERYQTAQELQAELEAFALEHRLPVTTLALARFVAALFRDTIDAWHAAQRQGASLADHVSRSMRAVDVTALASRTWKEPEPSAATVPEPSTTDVPPPRPLGSTPGATETGTSPSTLVPPRRRAPLIIAVAVVLVAVAGAAAWLALPRLTGPAAVAPGPASAPAGPGRAVEAVTPAAVDPAPATQNARRPATLRAAPRLRPAPKALATPAPRAGRPASPAPAPAARAPVTAGSPAAAAPAPAKAPKPPATKTGLDGMFP